MTFYEAALRILEEAGSPLHYQEITRRSLDKGLLSHVGKLPDVTMLARLAAMAKRPRDKKLTVTAKDTFALADWMLSEDGEALSQTGPGDAPDEANQPPYRTTERHPEPRVEYLRSIGRQADRKRRDDDRRKKYPPVPEVAHELLSECKGALTPAELMGRARAAELISDELSATQIINALAQDNQARLDQSRRPAFAAARGEKGELQFSLEPADGTQPPLEVQAEFCKAAGLNFEDGRVVLKERERDRDRDRGRASGGEKLPLGDESALGQTARQAVRDAKRAMARTLRRHLGELEVGTFERACVKLLHAAGFRELKVAKRSKDGPLFTARKKDGSLELRYAVRLLKGTQPVDRRTVQDIRRDVNHSSANIGLVLSAGDLRGDARSDATANGALVLLWCGDALGEKFLESEVGVIATQVALYEFDEDFFAEAQSDAAESQKRREERQRERDGRPEARSRRDENAEGAAEPTDGQPGAEAPAARPDQVGDAEGDSDAEGDAEGDDGPEAKADGAPGEGTDGVRRKRRRRRRRRGGRGDEKGDDQGEGATAAPGAEAPAAAGAGGETAPADTAPTGDAAEAAAAPVATEALPEADPTPSSDAGEPA